MSTSQIQTLFDFAGIKGSVNTGSLETVRHVLLLRIQSSQDSTIQIDGIRYTKEDILKLLDAAKTTSTFRPESIWEQFPELKAIQHPDTIQANFKGNREAFLSIEHLAEAQHFLSKNYADGIEKAISEHLKKREFFPASQRVTFLFAFDDQTRENICQKIKDDLRRLFETQQSFEFMTWETYYRIVQIAANDDPLFLELQYKTGLEHLGAFSYDQWSTFFRRQLTLNFDDAFLSSIEHDEKKYFEENKALVTDKSTRGSGSYGNSGNDTVSWKIIIGILVIILQFVFFMMKCERRNRRNRATIEFQEKMEEMRKRNPYYNRKFVYPRPPQRDTVQDNSSDTIVN